MIFLFPRWDMLIPWRVILNFQDDTVTPNLVMSFGRAWRQVWRLVVIWAPKPKKSLSAASGPLGVVLCIKLCGSNKKFVENA